MKQARRDSNSEESSWEETPNRVSSTAEYIRSTSPEVSNSRDSPVPGDTVAVSLFPSTEDISSSMTLPAPAGLALSPQTHGLVDENEEISEISAPDTFHGSPKPYLRIIKEKKGPRSKKGRKVKESGDEGINSTEFTEIVTNNLKIWKAYVCGGEEDDNVRNIRPLALNESILGVEFWDMNSDNLDFQRLNSKFRHCLHEICESLDLHHESSGASYNRIVTVSRKKEASGHDLSKASYGCQYYDFDVPKQKTISKLLTMSPRELKELEDRIDDPSKFEARYNTLYVGRAIFSLATYPGYDFSQLIVINNEEELREMCESKLRGHTRMGFDLEWHSYRSYLGVTCTIQLNVGQTVIIVDALRCFDSISECLGPFFEDPNILKCGLCIDQDVAFLFRDFGIVSRAVVDLQKFAALLHPDQMQLGYVDMLKLCECHPTDIKRMTMHKETTRHMDWRLRPLTTAMMYYAGADAYYLLPCFDVIASRLMAEFGIIPKDPSIQTAALVRGSLQSAIQTPRFRITNWRSNKFYKQYQKEQKKKKKEKNGSKGPKKKDRAFVGKNEHVLAELYAWRDKQAFESDESLHFVASPLLLYETALRLPATVDELIHVIATTRGAGYPEKDLNLTAPAGVLAADLPSPSLEARMKACTPLLMATRKAIEAYEEKSNRSVPVNVMESEDKISGTNRRRAWAVKLIVAVATIALLKVKGKF